MDKAATTASLLPQFARQCFSFEDTTIHDDTFFVMLVHLHAGGEARIILTNIKDFWEWHSFPPSTTVMAMPPLWEQIHV